MYNSLVPGASISLICFANTSYYGSCIHDPMFSRGGRVQTSAGPVVEDSKAHSLYEYARLGGQGQREV
jgi:hypothetical protein